MYICSLKPLVAVTLVTDSLSAVAGPTNSGYVGANLGTGQYPDKVNDIPGDGSPVSGKVFGGYQFAPDCALEGGASELGSIDAAGGKLF